MIFGRKKAQPEPDDLDDDLDDELIDDDDSDDDSIEAAEPEETDEWARFDASRDWRDDGPFDIDEVDLDADDDEIQRIDLGALIITPEPGMAIKLVADAATQQVRQVVVEHGQAAAQLTVFAAPATGDYRGELRQEMIAQTAGAKVVELAKGPFGTELRRVLTVTDAEGREGFAPLRDWLIAGPRWVLDVRLIGQAAIDSENKELGGFFEEFVRNLIVRRGDTAMAPGSVVPLQPTGQK